MEHITRLLYRIVLAALGGLPLLLLALLMLRVWMDPMSVDDGGWVRLAATMVLVEFLLLHSGAFMAAGPVVCERRWLRLAWFLGFGLVYFAGLFAFARWTGGQFVIWLLFGVLVSRLFSLVVLDDKKATIMMLQRSAMGIMILVLTALIIFLPLPKLGITEEVRYAAFGKIDDLLSEYPERTMAWGVLYYLIMGCVEVYVGWWLPNWRDEDVEKGWEALKK